MWNSALREKLNYIFYSIFTSTDKKYFLIDG